MSLYRTLLPAFSGIDAEALHHLSLRTLAGPMGEVLARNLTGRAPPVGPGESVALGALRFDHPFVLAAGFDKDALALPAWAALGFSGVEVGTLTPRAQLGNARPRLHRSYAEQSLWNAMGFNNEGAAAARRRIEVAKPKLPLTFRVGVNLGKNADTTLSDAAADYARVTREVFPVADYLVVNVSSPNTAGLRSLQSFEGLAPILDAVFAARGAHSTPVLVKLAPELSDEDLGQLIERCEERFALTGWILTNTLRAERPAWAQNKRVSPRASGTPPPSVGGLSGAPVRDGARAALTQAQKFSQRALIASGGVTTPTEACARLAAGARLVQSYAGLVLWGPHWVRDCRAQREKENCRAQREKENCRAQREAEGDRAQRDVGPTTRPR